MDSDAFAGFYQRSAPALRAYLTRVSGNHALAEDVMQESYLRFLCATRPEGGEVNYRRYLYRIATNLLRDHWRRPGAACIEDVPEQFLAARDRLSSIDSQAML
jgi:RNA polymerase sigma-70 factor (ECF subfamily)